MESSLKKQTVYYVTAEFDPQSTTPGSVQQEALKDALARHGYDSNVMFATRDLTCKFVQSVHPIWHHRPNVPFLDGSPLRESWIDDSRRETNYVKMTWNHRTIERVDITETIQHTYVNSSANGLEFPVERVQIYFYLHIHTKELLIESNGS